MRTTPYEEKLAELHFELVKMQYWIKETGQRLVLLFEGRDAAGKGGAIKCISEPLNPRGCRVVALGTPSDREKTQWYFQRYVAHLPAAGEIVLFDRSWYNRAGVEHVMGFCSDEEYDEFLRSCPEFEHPARRWKLSPMDLQSMPKWVEYSKAKDQMFHHTDTKQARWWTVEGDNKRRARLNCIAHVLGSVPYKDMIPPPLELPPRGKPDVKYVRPPRSKQHYVPALKV